MDVRAVVLVTALQVFNHLSCSAGKAKAWAVSPMRWQADSHHSIFLFFSFPWLILGLLSAQIGLFPRLFVASHHPPTNLLLLNSPNLAWLLFPSAAVSFGRVQRAAPSQHVLMFDATAGSQPAIVGFSVSWEANVCHFKDLHHYWRSKHMRTSAEQTSTAVSEPG